MRVGYLLFYCCTLCACHVVYQSLESVVVIEISHFGDEVDFPLLIMMATFGKIDEFDASKEEWSQYVECLMQFFLANGIDEAEKKRAVFLSVIGLATFKLLRNLLAPEKPGEKAYDALITTLSAHFSPAPSEIVQRFKFHSRFRNPGESVATFVSEIRSLAEFCNFGHTLEEMLRDRIVCGINDDTIQCRLLAEPELTYKKVLEISQGIEAANRNMRELHQPSANSSKQRDIANVNNEINKVAPNPTGKSETCYRCGKTGHKPAACRFKDATCRFCGKVGHLKAVCYSRKKAEAHRKKTGPQACPVLAVSQTDAAQQEDTDEYPYTHCVHLVQHRQLQSQCK